MKRRSLLEFFGAFRISRQLLPVSRFYCLLGITKPLAVAEVEIYCSIPTDKLNKDGRVKGFGEGGSRDIRSPPLVHRRKT
jgi:hypothetical protein